MDGITYNWLMIRRIANLKVRNRVGAQHKNFLEVSMKCKDDIQTQ